MLKKNEIRYAISVMEIDKEELNKQIDQLNQIIDRQVISKTNEVTSNLPFKMVNKDKTLSVKITIEEFEKLQQLADSDSRSVSSLVRLLIINLINGNITVNRCEMLL